MPVDLPLTQRRATWLADLRSRSHTCALAISASLILGAYPSAAQNDKTLTLVLSGQSMIRSDLRVSAPDAVPAAAPLIDGDVNFTNFEAAVIEPGQPNAQAPTTRPNGGWLTPPGALASLQAMGFNLLSFSNNHIWDLKVPGIKNTLNHANKLGLTHAGAGNNLDEASRPTYLRTDKGTVALIATASGSIEPGAAATATRPGINEIRVQSASSKITGWGTDEYVGEIKRNEEDAQRILKSIREARKKADIVVVSQHNHIYGKPFAEVMMNQLPERLVPAPWTVDWAREQVDAGADVIVMHGAPLVQGVEIYRGKPIFYDLGNFIFNMPPTGELEEPMVWQSVVARLTYDDKKLKSVHFKPVSLNRMGIGDADVHNPRTVNQFLLTRGLPTPAKDRVGRYILERLAESSRGFGTKVVIDGETARIDLSEK